MKNATFRQLRVFNEVARHLSFARAAEVLHLTPPAVTMQVKELEGHVGLPLFERSGRQISLTTAGEYMLVHARKMLATLKDAEDTAARLKRIEVGRLTIGMVSTAKYFLPRLLAEFQQEHEGVEIRLAVGNREQLVKMLHGNEVDIAIMGLPPEGLGLDFSSLLENPLVVIAPHDHPLAGKRAIPLARIQQENFIIREQGSGTRSTTERFLEAQGIRLNAGTEMSKNESIKQAVQAGMGLSILPLSTVMLELETSRLAVLDVESFPIQRHWYVVHRTGKRLSGVALAFKEFLLNEAAALLGPQQGR